MISFEAHARAFLAKLFMNKNFDVLIIGAGVNGLATAYHLSKRAGLKIGLIEQFSLGHAHGSSHGFSRIFRSTYTNAVYRNLAKRAQTQEWPSLEEEAGRQLIYPTPRCIFGSGSSFDAYIKTILKDHSDGELLEMPAARRLFPQFVFPKSVTILQDLSSGLIAAKDVMEAFKKNLTHKQVEILEETKVLHIDSTSDLLRLETSKGDLFSERLVITAGPWIGKIISEINPPFCPIRQIVGYFQLRGAKESYQVGRFPNWVSFEEDKVFYGLPEFACEGIKVAQDITTGKMEDPDEKLEIDPNKVKSLENFAAENFVDPVDHLRIETCFYTNTPTSDFILDLFPSDPRIAVGAACSGHAFKFAPLTGRILAELVLDGKTAISEFEKNRELFSIARKSSIKPCEAIT